MSKKLAFMNAFLAKIQPQVIVVAVQLPTSAIDIISSFVQLDEKMAYYMSSYNDDLELINNTKVKILDWMVL
jgi:hypothetical protein